MRDTASSLGSLRDDPGQDPGQLYGLAALSTVIDDLLQEAVAEARADGYSWADIGSALGMTRQAAQQRYQRQVLGADAGTVRAEGGD